MHIPTRSSSYENSSRAPDGNVVTVAGDVVGGTVADDVTAVVAGEVAADVGAAVGAAGAAGGRVSHHPRQSDLRASPGRRLR
jgi:hypothetical protein